ncbi:3,4-dihydroxy-2-butanone-4-phosphate synthase [Rhodococcoides kyotonense]|uniref:3,4-dihydroxy 2-butanone 4-phosphate synthase / GTP cyclohydrolase II n=1 Tax=Rhodococcoides kyotonense TaxID=398843 RepID=A0A239MT23_9NOCA|nr:3,4-dihydroxy-2-butanone-4-phosphate synthase [Rhodococcus kyotonensis]SNT45254.1 3,4-dihydroxy 2-butanone 4-phosphate synthase / GTP cyclohydrolase II [Rhodococcus kyotonensis]
MDCPTTRVQRALADLSAGRPVVLTGAGRDDDAHLVVAAEKSEVESVAFLVRYGSGLVCAALTSAECDRLQLTTMVGADRDHAGTEYTVSVDAVGPGTGISAADRARTLRLLSEDASTVDTFTRPGHVLPVRTADGGVLGRRGAAEATIDLTTIAGLRRAGSFTALVSQNDPTEIAESTEAASFATEHGLAVVSVEDVAIYRRITELHLQTQFTVARPSEYGPVHCVGFSSDVSGIEYVAYSLDTLPDNSAPLVRAERETDSAPHLSRDIAADALTMVAENGGGTVIVVRHRNSDAAVVPADTDADLVEIVRECGYSTSTPSNFPPSARTMMWHFGMSIGGHPVDATGAPEPRRVAGEVVRGDQRGRELGFRTANVELDEFNSVADGVWAGRCLLPNGSVVAAAVSVGRRPTFYGRSGVRLLEAHLLDFSGDLYGVTIEVRLDHWMRGQTTFASKEELIAALSADVIRTRALVGTL